MKYLLINIFIVINIIGVFAQDTIFVEPSSIYSENSVAVTNNEYNKAVEIIKFSDDFFKFESCYYLDKKRFVEDKYSQIYHFTNDSTLFITHLKQEAEQWICTKKNDSLYIVSQIKEGKKIVKGEATRLIPLNKHGKFTNYRSNGKIQFHQYYENNKYLKTESKIQELGKTYMIAEQMPEFPGGDDALNSFINKNLIYPKISKKKGVTGKVYVRFVVTKTGNVANIAVVKSLDEKLDLEAVKVVAMLPKFKSGLEEGMPVNVYYSIFIEFK